MAVIIADSVRTFALPCLASPTDPLPASNTAGFFTAFSQDFVNPKPFLQELAGKPVIVKLKWGTEYKGDCLAPAALAAESLLKIPCCWSLFHALRQAFSCRSTRTTTCRSAEWLIAGSGLACVADADWLLRDCWLVGGWGGSWRTRRSTRAATSRATSARCSSAATTCCTSEPPPRENPRSNCRKGQWLGNEEKRGEWRCEGRKNWLANTFSAVERSRHRQQQEMCLDTTW